MDCAIYLFLACKGYVEGRKAPIIIKDNAFIGARSIILKGVTIGEGAIVGAGSVVSEDVPPFTVVCENPAKVVKSLQ